MANKHLVLSSLVLILIFYVFQNVLATVTVTPATGGSSISADTTGGTYTSLTGPIISEGATADIGTGTIILNVPSGFVFDIGGTAPTVLVTRTAGSGPNNRNINDLASGSTIAVTATVTQLTITITAATSTGVINSLTWQNVRVRPTAGTPLASGNITKTGTSSILGVTDGATNMGTLTEVVGAKSQVVITTQTSSSATTATDFTTKPVVAIRDQFGNTVTTDSSSTITRTAVLSTQSCGGTAGSGTLSSTPSSGSAVTSGVLAYTAMQYSAPESIKICFASSGITSALSNTIIVSAPSDTTAPAAVSNLATGSVTALSIALSWTAPGDDNSIGTATSYDLRYSTSVITASNFISATAVIGEPIPSVAGSSESMTVSGLSENTTYFFALKTSDEVPNTSTISNVPSGITLATPTPTSSVTPTPTPTSEELPVIETTGGGIGGNDPTRIIFSGRAFPGAILGVYLIGTEYGQVLIEDEFRTQDDGSFRKEVISPVEERRLYGLLIKDKNGKPAKSKFFTYDLRFNTIVHQEKIIFAPSITTNKSVFTRNELLLVSGYAAPGNIVETLADGKIIGKTKVEDDGLYKVTINTNVLILGIYKIQTRQFDSSIGKMGDMSETKIVRIGYFPFTHIDFNQDSKINISDWSIFLSNWGSSDADIHMRDDLNGDKKIDISDLSVFLTSFQLSSGH